jgi:hypothetical protein
MAGIRQTPVIADGNCMASTARSNIDSGLDRNGKLAWMRIIMAQVSVFAPKTSNVPYEKNFCFPLAKR